ncbi:LPS-assembly protein like [Actinidia chinensis var. chinensis]|uniref:LPS-assembly protein like n=1 Tax=Actinidia chinensis var. chinensis TaxID=1590841 RepID=A0A2R6Q052_ACTCC|nr:LPS-assembly protein like [Actinidia chinensis var. chinensis]
MMDADMMEAETATPPLPEMALNSDQGGGDVVRGLLALARQLIDQGKPSQALQSVVMAMKTKGGDDAVFQTLNRASELYRNKLQASAAADELASLFAECAIAEALPLRTVQSEQYTVGPSIEPDAQGTSILAESGRKQIVLDAFLDGSSFVCLQCGGLVSNHRKDEHYAYWCCKI